MSTDLLSLVLERADAAIVACDLHGNISVFNAAARALFGGTTLPGSHPLFQALRDGASSGVEVISGDAHSILVNAEPLLDAQGNKLGAVATCAPLSAASAAKHREGEDARKKLELLLESTGEGIFGIDLRAACTFVNGSAAAMLGWMREDLLGKRVHDLIHHTDKNGQPYPLEACPILRAFREGRGCRVDDEKFFRADGSFFPVEYSSYPILDGGTVQGAVVTFSDITARKRAEEALRQSEAKYRTLFETISEGVFQTSPNGELLAANRALVEMLGYASENELRAQDVNDLYVNRDDRKQLSARLEKEGKLVDASLMLKCKDGRIIQVIENARAIHDDRQRVVYYEGTLTLVR
ncbi:MAG TPA: PAS domain S-box protein [Bryobacteraceae bacterium]|nr:PAS domain S-box protein [Bryobacteraceae bacterium]